MGYHYHTQTWPVVRFEFVGRMTAEETDQYFADADALIAGGKPYATVMDGTDMLVPEAEFVRRQARWLHDHSRQVQQLNRGIAFVVQSTLIRGLVRAVMHFQEMPVAYEWFSHTEDAMVWAAARSASVYSRA